MILKIFSPKKMELFSPNTATLCKKMNIGSKEKFSPKIGKKIAQNCDNNIDPVSLRYTVVIGSHRLLKSEYVGTLYKDTFSFIYF
jgi:hypothetical protein